ncbi:hypothetical protein Q4574_09520 [Aliiglaciecola sp. 3_MG-2023]|uniref:hypothetical protein n=1 Tax=Aliiglaciecola sp. 3_MG-2023 TaxID=3062644 RepID=UPI0026E2A216|nr:hypothetical protein [Aliiglaciecola sp. 3_MG-2023]MDO6693522.1 hypothetical protein [Aliiglaciecola sp. 3_MG-2023]
MFIANSFKVLSQGIIVSSTVLFLSGCIIHVGGGSNDTSHGNSVSSVYGDLEVSQGKHVSNVSSVNGSIQLHDDVKARSVDTVNGSIKMGAYVSVQNANTVNGDIEAEQHFNSASFVKAVNGNISLQSSSKVAEDVETMNGDITLNGVLVEGSLRTHTGNMLLTNNTQVLGDIIFHKSNNSKHSVPTLSIKQGATVTGQIILYREVELNIDDAQLLNKIEFQFDNDK